MIRYIHGSRDSTDVDIHYVFETLPEKNFCKKFCSEDPNENRNIIVITNGIVSACYKGTIDEINNALIDTYDMHEQEYPLLITRKVPRILCIKFIRAVRGILSHLSRSQYRSEVKRALQSNWNNRLNTLLNIDLTSVDFTVLNSNMSKSDILKVIAFQIGQSRGLLENKELYTKHEIAEEYPELYPYLYRNHDADISVLNNILHDFCNTLLNIPVEETGERTVKFIEENREIELIHETFL